MQPMNKTFKVKFDAGFWRPIPTLGSKIYSDIDILADNLIYTIYADFCCDPSIVDIKHL